MKVLGVDLKLKGDELGLDLSVKLSGDLELVEGGYNLAQAIINRLMTRRGELAELGHPNYGSTLYQLIGEPNNERTRELIKMAVKECVVQDPRVKELLSVSVKPDLSLIHI